MTIISIMGRESSLGRIKGTCANCHTDVFERSAILQAAGSAWAGRCPACRALNYADFGATRPDADLTLRLGAGDDASA